MYVEYLLILLTLFVIYPSIFQVIFNKLRLSNCRMRSVIEGYYEHRIAIVIPIKKEPISIIEEQIKHLQDLIKFKKLNICKIYVIADEYSTNECELIKNKFSILENTHVICREKSQGIKADALNYVTERISTNDITHVLILDIDSKIKSLPNITTEDAIVPNWYPNSKVWTKFTIGQFIGYTYLMKVLEGLYRFTHWIPILGSGSIIRLSSLKKVNYFSNVILEDVDLGLKMYLQNYKIKYDPNYIIEIEIPYDYSSFLKQQYRWCFGVGELVRIYFRKFFKNFKNLTILLYLIQYLAHFINLFITYLILILFILNVNISITTQMLIILFYSLSLGIYYHDIVKHCLDLDIPVKKCTLCINRVNMAFLLGSIKLFIAFLKGLFKKKITWIPTPKVIYFSKIEFTKYLNEFLLVLATDILFLIVLLNFVTNLTLLINNLTMFLFVLIQVIGLNWSFIRLLLSHGFTD